MSMGGMQRRCSVPIVAGAFEGPDLALATPPLWSICQRTRPIGSGLAFTLGGPRLYQFFAALGYSSAPDS
jgi:hypothetical protein